MSVPTISTRTTATLSTIKSTATMPTPSAAILFEAEAAMLFFFSFVTIRLGLFRFWFMSNLQRFLLTISLARLSVLVMSQVRRGF